MKKKILCEIYKGKLDTCMTSTSMVFGFFFFWIIPFLVIAEIFRHLVMRSFWLDEEEYHKSKILEIRADK